MSTISQAKHLIRAAVVAALATTALHVAGSGWLSITAMTGAAAATPAVTVPGLRFDGVYQSDEGGKTWAYLRFYKDGTVLAVGAMATPAQLAKWFVREQDRKKADKGKPRTYGEGKYSYDGKILSFSTASPDGTVNYSGSFDATDGKLKMKWESKINGATGTTAYAFVPW
jgi:hypothetical protein